MAFGSAARLGNGRGPARSGLLVAGGVVGVVVVAVLALGGLYTDLLWFRSVGFSSVYTRVLEVKVGLFLVAGLALAGAVGANAVVAYRLRPAFRPRSPEQDGLERYRLAVEPRRRLVLVAGGALLTLLGGLAGAGHWQTWVQFRNGVRFGRVDPQFHRDIGYWVFTFPAQRLLLSTLLTAVVLSLLVAAAVHYLFGALRLQTPGEKLTPAARAHLSLLLGAFVLLKAVAYWLDRYALAFSPRGIVQGPSYTDVNAVLPAKTILACVAVICAAMFVANVWVRNWTLPLVSAGVLVVSAVVIGGIYPALVEQLQVKPNRAVRERPYLQRMIDSTRFAFGIDTVTPTTYDATTTAKPGQLRGDADTTASIRLLDPNEVSPTFDQLQQIRGYYAFPKTLGIDRYQVNGTETDTVIAARELNPDTVSAQNDWIKQHLVFTHGYGVVAAAGNRLDADGRPSFFERDIPPSFALGQYEPRIYFGQQSPDYSIVSSRGSAELDRPDDKAPGGQQNTSYHGRGGVPLDSVAHRLLYALQFGEKNILLSSAVNSGSQILYDRKPADRVRKVAPWLRLDGDPYPAVVDGRVLWIVDGYTTTNLFPYSQSTQIGDVTQDTLTAASGGVVKAQDAGQVNYIRNSVKATVDAYDGSVTLYAWDGSDPLLRSWMRAFPGTVKPRSAMPAQLLAHVRYPEDLFKVQRERLTSFHVTDAAAFYSGQDFWSVPLDPTSPATPKPIQPPYYLTLRMPDQDQRRFQLTTPFVPRNRDNLAAFAAVDSDPGPDYGHIRVLQLPRNTQVNGPGQVDNAFESYPPVSTTLSLLRGGGSSVDKGNQLTLPVGGGLLYVQPIYVKGNAQSAYPLVQKVLVSFGSAIGFENDLAGALNDVFGGSSGAATQPAPARGGGGSPSPVPTPAPAGGVPGTGLPGAGVPADVTAVQQAFDAGQAALRRGDLKGYADAQDRLAKAIAVLVADRKGQRR